MAERLRRLAHLADVLGDAVTIDDIARAALGEVLAIDGVVRGGLALSEGGGRELRFVPSDPESLSPLGVRWCTIDAYDDVPVAHAVRRREVVYLPTLDDLARHYPGLLARQEQLGFAVRDVTQFDRVDFHWPRDQQGVLIVEVVPGGWAQMGGLQANDLVLSIGDAAIADVAAFERVVGELARTRPAVVRLFLRRAARTHFVFLEPAWNGAREIAEGER